MTDMLQSEINDAITKNLPHQVGSVLQARLVKAEADAKALAEAQIKIQDLTQNLEAKITELLALKEEVKKHVELGKREAAVADKEREQKVFELTQQLTASQVNAQFARDVALGLVRNTEYRSMLSESNTKNHMNTGGYTTQATDSSCATETKSAA